MSAAGCRGGGGGGPRVFDRPPAHMTPRNRPEAVNAQVSSRTRTSQPRARLKTCAFATVAGARGEPVPDDLLHPNPGSGAWRDEPAPPRAASANRRRFRCVPGRTMHRRDSQAHVGASSGAWRDEPLGVVVRVGLLGRSGVGACPNLPQRRPGPGSTAVKSAEYQRFSSRVPARSGPLWQIWTTQPLRRLRGRLRRTNSLHDDNSTGSCTARRHHRHLTERPPHQRT